MSSPIRTYPNTTSGVTGAKDVTGTDVSPSKRALDVYSLGGKVTSSGLSIDYTITTMTVTDVAAALPATNLTLRNAVAITNLDVAETLYIGKATVTANRAAGTTAGWEVGPGETFQVDITDSLSLYGRAEAGKSILIKILEVA
jgi:hypothetical protein